MHVHIDTTNEDERERIVRLMQFALHGHREHIDSMHLTISRARDALGTDLIRCGVRARLRHDPSIEVHELQSSLDLAVRRALERCLRTVSRRLGIGARRYSR